MATHASKNKSKGKPQSKPSQADMLADLDWGQALPIEGQTAADASGIAREFEDVFARSERSRIQYKLRLGYLTQAYLDSYVKSSKKDFGKARAEALGNLETICRVRTGEKPDAHTLLQAYHAWRLVASDLDLTNVPWNALKQLMRCVERDPGVTDRDEWRVKTPPVDGGDPSELVERVHLWWTDSTRTPVKELETSLDELLNPSKGKEPEPVKEPEPSADPAPAPAGSITIPVGSDPVPEGDTPADPGPSAPLPGSTPAPEQAEQPEREPGDDTEQEEAESGSKLSRQTTWIEGFEASVKAAASSKDAVSMTVGALRRVSPAGSLAEDVFVEYGWSDDQLVKILQRLLAKYGRQSEVGRTIFGSLSR